MRKAGVKSGLGLRGEILQVLPIGVPRRCFETQATATCDLSSKKNEVKNLIQEFVRTNPDRPVVEKLLRMAEEL